MPYNRGVSKRSGPEVLIVTMAEACTPHTLSHAKTTLIMSMCNVAIPSEKKNNENWVAR